MRWGFPSGSGVKNPAVKQETQEMWVRSLDQEDPLEEEIATYSSILVWEISMERGAWGYSPWDCKVGHNLVTKQPQQA